MIGRFFIDGRNDIPLSGICKVCGNPLSIFLYQLSLVLSNFARGIEAFLIQRSLYKIGLRHVDKIHTYTNKRELRMLYKLAAACPHGAKVIEIGSYLGASSCYLAAGLAQVKGTLLCIDTWKNDAMPIKQQDTFEIFLKNTHVISHLVKPLRKNSQDLSDCDIQGYFDLILIDGDHSYEAVRNDFDQAQMWVAPDGVIALHDFSNQDYDGVTRVVGEAIASGDWILVGLVDSLVWLKKANWRRPITFTMA